MPDLSPLPESWSQLTSPVTECVMVIGGHAAMAVLTVHRSVSSHHPGSPRGLANLPVFQLTCQTQNHRNSKWSGPATSQFCILTTASPQPQGISSDCNTWRGLSVLQPCGRLFHDSPSKTPRGNPVLTCWAVWAVEQTNHGVGSFIYIFKWAKASWETLFHTLYLHNIYQEIILTWGAQFGLRKR